MMPRHARPPAPASPASTPIGRRSRSRAVAAALVAAVLAAACTSSSSDAGTETTVDDFDVEETTTTELTITDEQRDAVATIGRSLYAPLATFDFATIGRPDDSRGIPTLAELGVEPNPGGYRGTLGTLGPDDVVVDTPIDPPTLEPGTDPLTGLPASGVAFTADSVGVGEYRASSHNAVVIKIDNAPGARPQSGLNRADIVFEEEVEGGITRFAAVFHSQLGEVGPIRSGRTSDISMLASLGSPSLVYSGANDVFDALIIAQPMVYNFSETRTAGFTRNGGYTFPSNLFSTVDNFAQPTAPPPPQFTYDAAADRSGWTAASSVLVDWGSTSSGWTWDDTTGQWLRLQNARAHQTDDGQVAATNVAVVTVDEVATGLTDSIGTPIPEYVFVGTGAATVFVDGRAIEGTWTRPTLRDPAVLTTADGSVIALNPGRTWVQLVVAGSTSWS